MINKDDLMKKHCICNATIRPNRSLCPNCLAKYGGDLQQWPAWLQYLISDHQREWDARRNHDPIYKLPPDDLLYGIVIA